MILEYNTMSECLSNLRMAVPFTKLWLMDRVFIEHIGRNLKLYVDQINIKSKEEEENF